jgi:hypothetical protein
VLSAQNSGRCAGEDLVEPGLDNCAGLIIPWARRISVALGNDAARTIIAFNDHRGSIARCRADAIKFVLFAVTASANASSECAVCRSDVHPFATGSLYALTFVVVEGYRKLALEDPVIDQLLAVPIFVEELRRFRNGVFHYHADPVSSKLMDLITAQQSQEWMQELHREFQRLFLEMPIESTKRRWVGKAGRNRAFVGPSPLSGDRGYDPHHRTDVFRSINFCVRLAKIAVHAAKIAGSARDGWA